MDPLLEAWKTLFENWPASILRQGVIVTKQGESIPFQGFLFSPSIVLLDRGKPDATGSRKVILPFDQIAALKIPGLDELDSYQTLGFEAPRA